MLIDLHVHSHHTRGGTLHPRDVLARAAAGGLAGVAFTDLNTLDALEEVRAAGRESGLLALVGVEVAADHGRWLCFFPDPARVPPPPQVFGSATPWPVREVLAKVKELGGVAVAAHPYDKTTERPVGDLLFTLDGLAAIQGLHGRTRGGANDLAIEAADHMNLPCVGGSGALTSLDEVGVAATLFRDPVTSEADLVAQLRAGTVYCAAVGVTPPPPGRGDRPGRRDERGGRGGRDDRGRGGRGGDRPGGRGRGGPRRER
jgi:predicted metal-dependent phosphoesterase TrpH